jgi:hypothetical protein
MRISKDEAMATVNKQSDDFAMFKQWAVRLRLILKPLFEESRTNTPRISFEVERSMRQHLQANNSITLNVSAESRVARFDRISELLSRTELQDVDVILPFTRMFLEKRRLEISLRKASGEQMSSLQSKVLEIQARFDSTEFHPMVDKLIEVFDSRAARLWSAPLSVEETLHRAVQGALRVRQRKAEKFQGAGCEPSIGGGAAVVAGEAD